MKQKNRAELKLRNWNLFSGDSEYKMNFALKFDSPFTLIKYKQEIFQRFLLAIKGMIVLSLILWLFLYHSDTAIKYCIGIIFHIFALYFSRIKHTPTHIRLCFVPIEIILYLSCFTKFY